MRDLILRPVGACLARRLTGLRDDGGRGAIAVLVAVFIGAGVLFGMAAMVIDVGRLYQNRAELQNGADAGALAVAQSCAGGNCTQTVVTSLAAQYANANASSLTGDKASVTILCGSEAGANNTTVPVGTGNCSATKVGCPAIPTTPPNQTTPPNYVDVETSTPLSSGGSSVLQPFFARTLGSGSIGPVRACAQAEWGGPLTDKNTPAFTISACTWDGATDGPNGVGTSFAPIGPYPTGPGPYPAYAQYDQVINFENGGTGGCATEPATYAPAGNFGWINDPSNMCAADVEGSGYGGSTGASPDNPCKKTYLPQWQAERTVLYVPVYNAASPQPGSNATYTLKGFAAFVLTGISLPGVSANDWVTGRAPNCDSSSHCITGFFTHVLVDTPPGGGAAGGANLGATVIKLNG